MLVCGRDVVALGPQVGAGRDEVHVEVVVVVLLKVLGPHREVLEGGARGQALLNLFYVFLV